MFIQGCSSFLRRAGGVVAVAAAIACAPAAHADSFNLTVSGSGVSSSIHLTVTPTGTAGTYQVIGVSGYYSDSVTGISGAITGLMPASLPTPDQDGFFPAPAFTAGGFSYDNLFYPSLNSPPVCIDAPAFFGGAFDIYGTAFTVAGGYTVDLWSDGALGGYQAGEELAGTQLNAGPPFSGQASAVSVNVATSPEPSSLLLLGTGIPGAVVMLRRRYAR